MTIGREELYERVWQTPMIKLAKEFGVFDQGLAKICKRHAIPFPPRGYWAKKANGIPVSKPPLTDLPSGVSAAVTIRGASEALLKAMETKKRGQDDRAVITTIAVPEDLRGLHSVVAAWIEDHKRDRARRRLEIKNAPKSSWWKPDPILDLTERDLYRFRVTSAFLKAVIVKGGNIRDGKIRGDLVVEFSGEKIEITVMEKMRQMLKSPPASWTAFPGHHNSALHPSGFLRFSVKNFYGGGCKKEWIETDKVKAADMLPGVLAGLRNIATAMIEDRKEREERHLRYE